MLKKILRPFAVLTAIGVVMLGLTGCSAAARESVDKYEAALSAVPGVIGVTVSTSTPLPGAVSARATVEIPADETVLEGVLAAACSVPTSASVTFTLRVQVGEAMIESTPGGGSCPKIGNSIITVASDVGATGEAVFVRIPRVTDGLLRISLTGDDLDASGALAVAEATARHLKQIDISIETFRLQVGRMPRATALQAIADLRAVDAVHPFTSVTVDDTAVTATIAGSTEDADDAIRMLRDSTSGIWGDRQIQIGTEQSGNTTGAGPEGLRLIEWIQSELAPRAVSASHGRIDVTFDGVDEIADASQRIAANNPDQLPVHLNAYAATPAFRVGQTGKNLAISPDQNSYPEWVRWWQQFDATGLVETVEVGDTSLEVWLTNADYTDADAIAQVTRIAERIAKDAGLDSFSVNNRMTQL